MMKKFVLTTILLFTGVYIGILYVHTTQRVETAQLLLPIDSLTPGAVMRNVTKDEICVTGYSSLVRSVSSAKKKQVFELYNVEPKSDNFGIDHLIPLQIGGSNELTNLWPLTYNHKYLWNKYRKDTLENKLRKMVCAGDLELQVAQREISKNWIAAHKKYIGDR